MTLNPDIQKLIYDNIRGCLLNLNGVVNYYLNSSNWAFKEDGVTPSVLTGADGYVMVEIPRFWYRRVDDGTVYTWEISPIPRSGFEIHPAFIKDGVEVTRRYIGAYDACFQDATDGVYKSGLNLDNATGLFNTAEDRLASVSGVYPIVGLTRNEARLMAANNGTGWRQLDFALASAVQLLYLIEHQSFFSQNILGAGNTDGSYLVSSSNQNDSPHTVAGAGNALGDGSTNTVTGAGVNAKPGISFMKYRGIENFYGNCWNWVDGLNININAAGTAFYTNNRANFVDDTSTNMTLLSSNIATASGFVRNINSGNLGFLPTSTVGSSSTTYITDQAFLTTSLNRVPHLGGAALFGVNAGVFCWALDADSSFRNRGIGARACF